MNDDLHPLRDTQNNSLVRLIFNRVRGLCGGSGYIGKTAESSAGGAPVPADAAKEADAPTDSGCDQGPIA